MASGFKNMTLAGADGAATPVWFSARRPSGMPRRYTGVVQQPCRQTLPVSERRLVAAIEGTAQKGHRQLKI